MKSIDRDEHRFVNSYNSINMLHSCSFSFPTIDRVVIEFVRMYKHSFVKHAYDCLSFR
jgi:hypothetical protein